MLADPVWTRWQREKSPEYSAQVQDFLTLEDGTDRFSPNVDAELLPYAA
jgi:hypothetical protein